MTGVPGTPYVLLEDHLDPARPARLFDDPIRIIRCDVPEDVPAALDAMAAANADGHYLAGFLAYELGYVLEPKLLPLLPPHRPQPLIWMGVFPRCREIAADGGPPLAPVAPSYAVDDLSLSIDRDAYLAGFDRVKDYIVAGDVYQINLTFKYRFGITGDPIAFYNDLRREQRVGHAALIGAEDFHVLSLSPELFLRTCSGDASMRPMKGTAPRGRTLEEDRDLKGMLAADEKSRAENLMILDLMRNDLGRLAEIGSVSVTDMFRVETFRSLHQMTSGVSARLRKDVDLPGLIRGIFPCGSVTGAPKIRAMEIIHELESEPRGVYTGAVGMIAPNGDVDLNVAIRTIMLDGAGHGELGIGSGIVFDSDGPAEFAESLLKADFMTGRDAPFELIETMRWDRDGGYYLLDEHLERLSESAVYFGFACDEDAVRRALDSVAEALAGPCHRVRLTLDEYGQVDVTSAAIDAPSSEARTRYVIAEEATDSTDRFLFHKTTRRQFYDRTRERLMRESGCDEAVFVNEKGELTEGSYTNLFVERDGRLLTPPLACGLLNGTLRRALLADPDCAIEEAVLTPVDLESADRVYLGNSVRGLVRAEPVDAMRRAG